MIQVNIWLPTTRLFNKRIKHDFWGPLLAKKLGENVGHVNFQLEIDERSKNYNTTATNPQNLIMQRNLKIVPEIISGDHRKYYAPKAVKSSFFTHSFWPGDVAQTKKMVIKDYLHSKHIGSGTPGVKSDLSSTHENDMGRENTKNGISRIVHRPLFREEIDTLIAEKNILANETNTLQNALDNKPKWENKISQLTTQKETLLGKQQILVSQVNELKKKIADVKKVQDENAKKIKFIKKKLTYIEDIAHPNAETLVEMSTSRAEIKTLNLEQSQLEAQLAQLNEDLTQLELVTSKEFKTYEDKIAEILKEIKFYQNFITKANREINGRGQTELDRLTTAVAEKEELIEIKEYALKNLNITEGRDPDHTIQLPTSESGFEFYIDELKVLETMEKEKSLNYSFVSHNCVTSAKNCLLAGIDNTLKEHLKKVGLPDEFFQLDPHKIETLKAFRTWVCQLESGLTKLNFPKEPRAMPTNPTH